MLLSSRRVPALAPARAAGEERVLDCEDATQVDASVLKRTCEAAITVSEARENHR